MKYKNLLFGIFFFLPFTIFFPYYPLNIYISSFTILIFSVLFLINKEISFNESFILIGLTIVLVTFYPLVIDELKLSHLILYYFNIFSFSFIIIPESRLNEKDKNLSKFILVLPYICFFIFKTSPLVFGSGSSNVKGEIKDKIKPSSSSDIISSEPVLLGSSIVGYDWCYPSCNDNVQSSFKFSSDGTFTFSTIMFGGMSRRGVWKDLGNGNIQTNDNQVGTQTVRKLSGTQIQVGSTIYNRY